MGSWFRDIDRLTPFIKALKPMLAKQLDSHTEQLYEEMVRNWEQGQDITGTPWEPNAPSTLRQKPGSTPLIHTRQMIESSGYRVDKSDLVSQIYIDDEDGKVLAHEFGVPERGIPPRPIMAPVMQQASQSNSRLLNKAFDRSWAQASRNGTIISLGIGNTSGGSP